MIVFSTGYIYFFAPMQEQICRARHLIRTAEVWIDFRSDPIRENLKTLIWRFIGQWQL